ncbi:AAA-domain-containing protein [Morchella conica CCBAS932]|uniref:Peroxisomal ATPase PEX6 n=1 Tax=Morchella conica CCBAS932 TaxID=1392247 RepID=A0A3N4L4P4_9PEZI|nr:AAA-domain-containing protein [Morchella conica CCBAS932]
MAPALHPAAMAAMAAMASSASASTPKQQAPPRQPLRKKRKNRSPIVARLVVDELRGDVGYVSEDIWRDVFGFIKQEPKKPEQHPEIINGETIMIDDEEPEEEPIPPTLHIAVTPLSSAREAASKKWSIFPVTFLPDSSQFMRLAPSTIMLPNTMTLPPQLSAAGEKGAKALGVLVMDVVPVGIETVIVNVRVPANMTSQYDQDLEDRVKEALATQKIVRAGDELPLRYAHGRIERGQAKIEICEPVEQGLILKETKIVILKERESMQRKQRAAVDGITVLGGGREHDGGSEGEDLGDEDEGDLEFSTFLSLPSPGPISYSSMNSTPYMRNGSISPNSTLQSSSGGQGKEFKTQSLTTPIPSGLLFPKPKDYDDDEARVFVKVGDLAKLGCFSGDWVRISIPSPPVEGTAATSIRTAAEAVARGRGLAVPTGRVVNGSRPVSRNQRDNSSMRSDDAELGRPVKIYSLPEGWESSSTNEKKKKRRSEKGKEMEGELKKEVSVVYLSPILLANISPSVSMAPEVVLSPFEMPTKSLRDPGPTSPPPAKEVTLLRIASPTSTDRALQPSLLLQLKSYFESCRRIVKKGDVIGVGIDEVLARSLYGDSGEDGITEELLTGNVEEGKGGKKTCVAWFKVGNIVSTSDDNPGDRSPIGRRGTDRKEAAEESAWSGVVFVDPATTRMVQAGSEKRKIPPTMSSTWEYYLRLSPPPVRLAIEQNKPSALVFPNRYINQTQRRLRELVSAATSPRAIQLGLQPIAILLTSTQRAIGKRTIAMRAASDVGVHVFHIDAYDIISDGGSGDVKTEGFLRARVDRALTCGKESCILLLSHIEALTAAKMGEVLKDIVGQFRIVVATTTEVDKLSDNVRNVFTHEMDVGAPDEKERAGLLEAIVDERRVRLGKEVELSGVAVKTAALVAGDLVDVVERAVAASGERVSKLAKKCRARIKNTGSVEGIITIQDLEIAGGDEATSILKCDFEVAVEAARRNFADSIGAPKIPNVSWDDVGGLANVKSAVMETIQLPLERPELFAKGMKKRSGILFYGPPGTGKTLLAKAIATEFSLNFFSVKGPELLNMYIGESEANVRRVFQRARDARPCVVFFDELDSVAPKRGNQGDSGGVMDRIVSQLLAELDGMSEGAEGSGGVFVIGATNRPDLLDAALLRPGRFDKMLYLGVSDTHDKQLTILEALTRKFALHPTLSLRRIAETLPFTYTGADLYALCSDAMLKAITRQAGRVDEKIRILNSQSGESMSTAYFFDHVATEEDTTVLVEEGDFEEAKNELVGSVSAKELEHYQRVREQFEKAEDDESKKKSQNKVKSKAIEMSVDEMPVYDNGKALLLDRSGQPLADSGLRARLQLDLGSDTGPATGEWEDSAAGDDEELYGGSS